MRILLDRLTGSAAGPDLDDATLDALYRPPRLPWLRANMVSTVDGAATGASGTSGSINNAADKRVFDLLRAQADAVLVGAGTARTEGYRPGARPIVLVSRSGEIPPTLRGAEAGAVRLVTVASSPGLAAARAALGGSHVLVAGESEVDLAAARLMLRDAGLASLLCEGGPHLLGDLVAAGLLDELCATTVPGVVGGDFPRITSGPAADVDLELAVLLEQESTLLGRWLVRR